MDPARPDLDDPSVRRRLLRQCIAIVAAVTAASTLVGYALPRWLGRETITVFAISAPVSPGAFALYGAVSTATFLLTFLLVLWVVSQFDDRDDLEEFD